MKMSCWQADMKARSAERNIGIGDKNLERLLPMGVTTLGGEEKNKGESLKGQVEKQELGKVFKLRKEQGRWDLKC